MHEFNQSLKYDKRMYAADIKGSIAFSKALLKAGILDESEQKEITRGLKQVEEEWAEGKVCTVQRYQDGAHDSLRLRPMMKISTPLTSDDLVRLSERILEGNYILVEVEMIRLQLICESGL